MTETTTTEAAGQKLRRDAQGLVRMLAAMFLLGMAVNLIGLPQETTGGAKVATGIFLTLHMILGIGLLVSGILALRHAGPVGGRARQLSVWGLVAVVVAIVAGVLTASTKSNWWSYLMAAAFLATAYVYVALLLALAPARRGTGTSAPTL